MKWLQNGNLAKMVAFFVIAVVIICTVSFAANGWQSFTMSPDSDNFADETPSDSDNVDENKDGDSQENDVSVVAPQAKYYHYLTGVEITPEESLKKPLCIVLSSQDPLYGISSSYLTVEIPAEHGKTRFLCFTDTAQSLGKIGSIAPSRGYISNIAAYFGGALLSYGYDDAFEYEYYKPDTTLDFLETSGYCYTEYNTLVYTNGDLVTAFLNNTKANVTASGSVVVPYSFNAIGGNAIHGTRSATNINIRYSDTNSTDFSYSETTGKYVLSKNSGTKNDLLNDKPLTYDNVFVLYADSTTHETSSSTQMILDTTTSGKGSYFCNGTAINISWSIDDSGDMIFYDGNGNKLTVNRGTSYIAFVKSSNESAVKIS